MDSTFNDLIDQAVAQLHEYQTTKKLKDILRVQTLVTELIGLYVPSDEREVSSDESPHLRFRSPFETEVFPSSLPTYTASAPIQVPTPTSSTKSVSQVATQLLRFTYDGNENKFKHRHVN